MFSTYKYANPESFTVALVLCPISCGYWQPCLCGTCFFLIHLTHWRNVLDSIFHASYSFLWHSTLILCPLFWKGTLFCPGKVFFFPPLIAEVSSGNLKTSLTIPSSLQNGLSYRLQSQYVLDCCGGPCLSVSNCRRMWCLLCPPDSYEFRRCKEHSACFLALPSIGILFRGNGCVSGPSAFIVTCLMVIGRQLTIWMRWPGKYAKDILIPPSFWSEG